MSERVVEAAKAIRPYLPDLLGEDAERFDLLVSGLLADAGACPAETAHKLHQLLTVPPGTARWLAHVLAEDDLRPPGHRRPALHAVGRSARDRFECPGDDFVWYRRLAGQRVPSCPTHGLPLRGADS